MVAALQRAVDDLPGGQPCPPVRAYIRKCGDGTLEPYQHPALTGQTHPDRLVADLCRKRHRMPEIRQPRMDVRELRYLSHAFRIYLRLP